MPISYTFKIAHYALDQCSRILAVMFNLCSTCKALCSTNSTFISLILLNYKIMSINSLCSSSTVKHAISNSSMYVYKHFEFIFIPLAAVINALKSLSLISPKSYWALFLWKICILCKFCQLCWQFLPIMLHYAHCFCFAIIIGPGIQCIWCGYNLTEESHSGFSIENWYFSKYQMWYTRTSIIWISIIWTLGYLNVI